MWTGRDIHIQLHGFVVFDDKHHELYHRIFLYNIAADEAKFKIHSIHSAVIENLFEAHGVSSFE